MSRGRRGSGTGRGQKVALALLLLLPAPGWAQAMYKWVDEKGVTHFTDQPPPEDRKASKIVPRVVPGKPGAYDPNAWKVREAESKRLQVERGRQERADDKSREKREQACERARRRIAFLDNSTRIFRDNPDGTRTWLDDKERAAEAAEARREADETCR